MDVCVITRPQTDDLTQPYFFMSFSGFKCPVCSKFILPDDIECHIVMCLTKPRLSYNGELHRCKQFYINIFTFSSLFKMPAEDVLSDQKGECVICLDDLNAGDTIARLPCLCIYHKG